jgi:hypothetical protein
MVIHYFYIISIYIFPYKTDPPLLFQREQGTGNREQEKLMFKNMRLK